MKTYNYIYLTTNLINGKIYIGKHSTNILNDKYIGSGSIIKKAISKYGVSNFSKQILAFADTLEKLNYLEVFYIRKYKSQESSIGYNIEKGGNSGIEHTEETKKKISIASKGRIKSKEECKHISLSKMGDKNPMYGTTGYWLGTHRSEETRKKISEALKGRAHRNTGYHHTEETKKKIGIASKGRTPWNKGLKFT